jgi:hypothetical protein
MTTLAWKDSIFAWCHMPDWLTRRTKECHTRSSSPSDGTDGTEGERSSRQHHSGWVLALHLVSRWFGLDGTRDQPPQSIKQKTNTENCLVWSLWSVNGIHSLLDVSKGTTYNTACFTDRVMPSLIENVRSRTRRMSLKNWLIHIVNAAPHNSRRAQRCIETSRAERLPHPVYSPDLPPRTSSSVDRSKKNYLIRIVRAGKVQRCWPALAATFDEIELESRLKKIASPKIDSRTLSSCVQTKSLIESEFMNRNRCFDSLLHLLRYSFANFAESRPMDSICNIYLVIEKCTLQWPLERQRREHGICQTENY